MEESKHEKFVRLSTNRTQKILNMLRLLGNCANKSNYEYNSEEVEKIFRYIRQEVDKQEALFMKKRAEKKNFTL